MVQANVYVSCSPAKLNRVSNVAPTIFLIEEYLRQTKVAMKFTQD